MDERNPLEIQNGLTLPKRSQNCNKRGRPSLSKAVKFSPQPKSMISQLLNKVQENCDNAKVETNLPKIEIGLLNKKNQTENNNVNNQLELDTEPEMKSYEDLQGSFAFDLASVDDGQDTFENSNLLHNKETNTHYGKRDKSESKLFEITCYVCSHRSSSPKAHRKHLSIHRNQPYNCNYPNCSYTCKLSSNLIKHKRIHTSEKPYLCDQCTFRTNFGNSLKVHKRIHTSERPYGCQYCSYQCNSSSNLKKHCLHRHRDVS